MPVPWQGVYPAVTTQFASDLSVDHAATLRHVDVLVDSGVHGLVMLGTVGENGSLEPAEKQALVAATARHVAGRVPVVAGIAENTTARAVRVAQEAEQAGADGLMVLPAMIYKADEREALAHFRAVARATRLPIMIYNNPVSYGVDLVPEAFAELAELDTVVAIKESSEDPRRITDLRRLHGERFHLLCGVDDLVFESVMLGAEGWVGGLVNAFPRENRLLWELLLAGELEGARAMYRWYTPLLHLDTRPKLVQYIKLAVQECGYGHERCRPPRLALEGAERAQVLGLIRAAIETRPAAAGS
jgi:4-hydroxy-tetrahydrodipicolinate synthase